MDALRQDLVYAFRVLRKDRAYAAAVILTLAICLGANTAIFTVVRSVLLRPLPYPESDRLVSSFDGFPGRRRRARRHLRAELRRQAGDDRRLFGGGPLSVVGLPRGRGDPGGGRLGHERHAVVLPGARSPTRPRPALHRSGRHDRARTRSRC